MLVRILSLVCVLVMANGVSAQAMQSVVYVEVATVTRPQAVKAFADYAAVARQQPGFGNVELFEQRGQPGHYVLIESWQQQAAFEAQVVEQLKLATMLQKLRISNIDRRAYQTFDTAPAKTANAPLYVISHIDAAPSPLLPDMLKRWVAAGRAEEGNQRFDIVQDSKRGNHFTVIAAWRDEAALQEHVESIPARRFRDEFGSLAGSPLDERLFDVVPL